MSKVITFSTVFPVGHPKKGKQTYFPHQIWNVVNPNANLFNILSLNIGKEHEVYQFWDKLDLTVCELNKKVNTIRAGSRWKVGDKFSPRVWSGKPYQSKMITIAPDIEIKKIWDIIITVDRVGKIPAKIHISISDPRGEINYVNYSLNEDRKGFWFMATSRGKDPLIYKNDGLSLTDFIEWFAIGLKKPNQMFKGQVLCWDNNIEY